MDKWIPCGEKFIVGDVVRWTEPVWIERGKQKKRLVKVGTRRVTAEVLTIRGYAYLSVCQCEILSNTQGLSLEPFKKDEIIRKKRSTIGKGGGERLKWSDEGARALTESKFFKGEGR
jgi:hypothetical protein